jgi:hypothetical protein
VTPKEKRDLLFKRGKPVIRKIEEKDFGVMWAAFKAGSFPLLPKDLTQEDFMVFLNNLKARYRDMLIIEDGSMAFPSAKRGPVVVVGISFDDLLVTPEASRFSWATKRNMLRAYVGMLSKLRYSTTTGVCMVRVREQDLTLAKHIEKRYALLHWIGKVSKTEHLFSIRGRASE